MSKPKERLADKIDRRRREDPLKACDGHLTAKELATAVRFIRDACMAAMVESPRVSTFGPPTAAPGPRQGGVADVHRSAYRNQEAVWRSLHPNYRDLAFWLIAASWHASRENRSIREIGAEFGSFKGKDQARAFGIGLIKALLWRIAEIYDQQRKSLCKD